MARSGRAAQAAAQAGSKAVTASRTLPSDGLPGLQDHAHHVDDLGLLRGVHHRAADVAALHGDEALGLEDPQRLTDGWEADAELLEQLVLLREHGAVGQLAREDAGAEGTGHHLGQAGLPELVAGGRGRGVHQF